MELLFHHHLEAEKVMQLMKTQHAGILVKRSRSICSSCLLRILFSVECELYELLQGSRSRSRHTLTKYSATLSSYPGLFFYRVKKSLCVPIETPASNVKKEITIIRSSLYTNT